jgi:hypothetical protein
VERKVWGLKAVFFVALMMCFNKGRPDWDVPTVNYGGRGSQRLVCNAHNSPRFGSERSFLI